MEPVELLQVLLELANDAGLEVRLVGGAGDEDSSGVGADSRAETEPPPASAVCRVRGRVYIVLSRADPVAIQLQVIAGAVRDHAGSFCDARYLPPAVRDLVSPG